MAIDEEKRKRMLEGVLASIPDDGVSIDKLTYKICMGYGITEYAAEELLRVLQNSGKIDMVNRDRAVYWVKTSE